jgi:hypothetical protein
VAPEPVECHSGASYGERPVALWWEGERLLVAKVLRRSRLPDGRGFRVRVEDGRVFDLVYHSSLDEWQIDQA